MDTRRLIAFVVFSLSLIWLWEAWQNHNHPQAPTAEVRRDQGAVSSSAPAPSSVALPAPTTVPATPAPGTPQPGYARGARAVVTTDNYRVEIDANGGDLRHFTLTRYRANDDVQKPFTLFDERSQHVYFAQSGLVGNDAPNHKTVFVLTPGEYTLKEGENSLALSLTANAGGVELTKTYTFTRGSYVIRLDQTARNTGSAPVQLHPYYQFLRHGGAPEGESAMMSSFTGPAVYTAANKFEKIAFADIDKGKQDFTRSSQDGWIGMVQHHFVAAWLPKEPGQHYPREFFADKSGTGEYRAGTLPAGFVLAPGATRTISMRLYAGPQLQEQLEALEPGLAYAVDYGWLTLIAYPLFVVLEWLHKWVANWGVAIILLTVLIKLAFYPLSAASYKSMAKMKKLAPRLQHIKERHGDDRQKLHEAMMKVYQEEKINPLGGCLPMLVQIPVFIALYWVLMGAVELRQAPFALWITDLSQKDPYYILPVVMAVTMFIQQRMSPPPPDPIQAKVMMAMPIVFSIFFFFFPSGLVLYWLVNNVLSILQQWRINVVMRRAEHVHR